METSLNVLHNIMRPLRAATQDLYASTIANPRVADSDERRRTALQSLDGIVESVQDYVRETREPQGENKE